MSAILSFVGRFLFSTFLISLAMNHLFKPENSVEHLFDTTITFIDHFQLPFQLALNANFVLYVKILGLAQALAAILIILGDNIGGILLAIGLLVAETVKYSVKIKECNMCEILKLMSILGISMIIFGYKEHFLPTKKAIKQN